ncbi:hypothetical protein PN462_21045 [Spirulina sp. CS-785/01]|uniref:DUF6876 family protein n=1 Tax=Spirulina sp. CS-785/01 TaxID=3021716 RepID=UPI00232DF250|nr:DUF6876 family protein [Spirulina sp. CS-785/01]MDB9315613.1 hypothetical protein [Spirulina sp. CS-785/01]
MLTEANLKQFTGTTQYYRHWLNFCYTDGVQFLAKEGQAYWLLDAIGSYQPQLRNLPKYQAFQLWFLVVGHEHPVIQPQANYQAVLTCWEDTPMVGVEPAIRQDIHYTDFPLAQVHLYWQQGVLMLPSEY